MISPRNPLGAGRHPLPPEQRRQTITFRLLPHLVEKARRLGNARMETMIARAKE